jgi:hypothetical protein
MATNTFPFLLIVVESNGEDTKSRLGKLAGSGKLKMEN